MKEVKQVTEQKGKSGRGRDFNVKQYDEGRALHQVDF